MASPDGGTHDDGELFLNLPAATKAVVPSGPSPERPRARDGDGHVFTVIPC